MVHRCLLSIYINITDADYYVEEGAMRVLYCKLVATIIIGVIGLIMDQVRTLSCVRG